MHSQSRPSMPTRASDPRRSLITYGLPVLAVTLTTIARLALFPVLGAVAPLVLYPFTVPVSAWYGGARAGLLATFLSAVIGFHLFIEPSGSWIPANRDDRIYLTLFACVGLGLTVITERWRRTLNRVSESEQHFRLLVDGAIDTAIFALDLQGRVQSWNPGAERIKGYRPDEIIGKSFAVFYTPEDIRDSKPDSLLREAAGCGMAHEEGWRVRKDGSRFWAEVSVTALRDPQGALLGYSKITRNRTERQALITAVTEREEINRALLESVSQGIVAADPEGRIVFSNHVAEKMFGYAEKGMSGESVESLLPHSLSERHRANRTAYCVNAIPRPMGLGIDLAGSRQDGSGFPIEVTLNTVNTARGPLTVAFIADLTDRKQAAEALRSCQETFRQLADNIPHGVWAAEPDGRPIYVNRRLLSYAGFSKPSECTRDVWLEMVHPEDRALWGHFVTNLVSHGEGADTEYRLRRAADREYRWHLARAISLRGSDGRVLQLIGTLTDIHDQKIAAAALMETQKLETIGLLAGGVAHNFNNILTSVSGNIGLVQENLDLHSESWSFLASAQESVKRAAILARQLLAYSGNACFYKKYVLVSDSASDAIHLLRPSLPPNVALTVDLDPGVPAMLMDPAQMQQIFMNLILNSAEAIGEKQPGVIQVRTSLRDGSVCIEISDTGCGMDQKTRERMFEPFFTTKFFGRGLGLAAVHGIVRSVDGQIEVDTSEGQGTRIRLLLPVAAPAGASAPVAQKVSQVICQM
jgi:two-component system cell cycle sensor histidine kinase/response regulator CckA